MCGNPPNAVDEKAVFEQANDWLRTISSTSWLMTSFFIILNLTVIKVVFSDLKENFYKSHSVEVFPFFPYWIQVVCVFGVKLFFAFIIFAVLWLVPALVILTVINISERVANLLINGNNLTRAALMQELKFECEWSEFKDIWKALKYPDGWIILVFTMFFLVTWLWVFLGFFK